VSKDRKRERARSASRYGGLAVVVLAVLFAAAVRIRVADVPFERDEGEYAYAGQLVLQGIPPYELAYNMKFPGAYYAYAAILALFGESPRGVHLGLLLVNAATAAFVYLLGRRLLGEFPGGVAGGAFAILSLDRWIMGVFAHATHFVILPVTAALWVLLIAGESGRKRLLLTGGALLGVAVFMKQHAIFFLALGAVLVAWDSLRRLPEAFGRAAGRVGWLAAGAAIPFLLLVALFAAQGVLGRFWFWTFQYAREYVSQIPLSAAPRGFLSALEEVTRANRAIWVAAAVGLCTLVLRRWAGEARWVLLGLLGASLLSLCPGFFFREHYFIALLPAVALLVGVAAGSAERGLGGAMSAGAARILVTAACAVLAAAYVIPERPYLFDWTPRMLSRLRYGTNPFVESVDIARYIRERTGPDDRIAVLGSEPQIYFYSGRRSATGYIYMYPLLEAQKFAATMQDEMIRQVESAHPSYVVFAQIWASWLVNARSEPGLLRWAQQYTQTCYDLVGVADIHSRDVTGFAWDDAAKGYRPRSQDLVLTYRRKSDAPCTVPR
jgi:hypothetical protein